MCVYICMYMCVWVCIYRYVYACICIYTYLYHLFFEFVYSVHLFYISKRKERGVVGENVWLKHFCGRISTKIIEICHIHKSLMTKQQYC